MSLFFLSSSVDYFLFHQKRRKKESIFASDTINSIILSPWNRILPPFSERQTYTYEGQEMVLHLIIFLEEIIYFSINDLQWYLTWTRGDILQCFNSCWMSRSLNSIPNETIWINEMEIVNTNEQTKEREDSLCKYLLHRRIFQIFALKISDSFGINEQENLMMIIWLHWCCSVRFTQKDNYEMKMIKLEFSSVRLHWTMWQVNSIERKIFHCHAIVE